MVVAGNISDAAERRGRVEWLHAAQDVAATVRDYTKWDDNPASLAHFGESAVRAYQIAMTPPTMPVVLAADGVLQEAASPAEFDWRIPKLPEAQRAGGRSRGRGRAGADAGGRGKSGDRRQPLRAHSRGLEAAGGTRRDAASGRDRSAAPHELPHAPSLNQTQRTRAAVADADVILGLEVYDFFGVVHTLGGQVEVVPKSITKPGMKLVSISSSDLFYKSNYQNFQRYQDVDLSIPADAEATLPELIEAVKRLLTDDRKRPLRRAGRSSKAEQRPGAGADSHGRILCVGRQPRQHRAAVCRTVGPDQERGLVAGVGSLLGQQLAAAAVGFHQALPVHRRARAGKAWGIWRRRPWARPSPTRSMAGSASPFRPTAI